MILDNKPSPITVTINKKINNPNLIAISHLENGIKPLPLKNPQIKAIMNIDKTPSSPLKKSLTINTDLDDNNNSNSRSSTLSPLVRNVLNTNGSSLSPLTKSNRMLNIIKNASRSSSFSSLSGTCSTPNSPKIPQIETRSRGLTISVIGNTFDNFDELSPFNRSPLHIVTKAKSPSKLSHSVTISKSPLNTPSKQSSRPPSTRRKSFFTFDDDLIEKPKDEEPKYSRHSIFSIGDSPKKKSEQKINLDNIKEPTKNLEDSDLLLLGDSEIFDDEDDEIIKQKEFQSSFGPVYIT